jgi:hypothetical protein
MTYYSLWLNLSTVEGSEDTGQLRNLPLEKSLITPLKSITALTPVN